MGSVSSPSPIRAFAFCDPLLAFGGVAEEDYGSHSSSRALRQSLEHLHKIQVIISSFRNFNQNSLLRVEAVFGLLENDAGVVL